MNSTQYRVTFTHSDTVNGSVVTRQGGSRWFNSREEAEKSHWVGAGMNIPCMSMDNAKIVSRLLMADGQPFEKLQTRFG